MNQTINALSIKFADEPLQELMTLAQQLQTTPVRVIAQAMVLLKKVQGKKIILREGDSDTQLVIDRYVK